jgi:hypothetical protein
MNFVYLDPGATLRLNVRLYIIVVFLHQPHSKHTYWLSYQEVYHQCLHLHCVVHFPQTYNPTELHFPKPHHPTQLHYPQHHDPAPLHFPKPYHLAHCIILNPFIKCFSMIDTPSVCACHPNPICVCFNTSP